VTDDGLFTQLRAYAEQLDELPVESRLARVSEARWRPPRWSRREWIALAAAIAVLVAVAVTRIADQSSGTRPSVGTGGTLRVARAWTSDLGAQVDRTIDVPGGRTIVDVAPETTGDSTLVALDRATGRVLWRHRFPFRNGPWGLDGNTLVTGINGRTAGIDVRTGKQLWLVDVNAVSGEQAPPIVVHDHVAYLVGGDTGVMTALHVPTHQVLWQQTLGGTVLITPVPTQDGIVAAVSPLPLGGGNGFIEVLDRATGAERSHTLVPGEAFVGLTSHPVDGVIAATNQRFGIPTSAQPAQMTLITDARTCLLSFGGIPSNPVAHEHEIVVTTSLGDLRAYRCAGDTSGVPLWERREVGANQQPAIERSGDVLIVAGSELSGVLGSPGSFRWVAPVRDAYFPAPAAGGVVVAASRTDGNLYVLDARDGRVITTVRDGTSQIGVTLRRDSMVTASTTGVATGYRVTRR
jgi:outer membrane protein assembly factor BamB